MLMTPLSHLPREGHPCSLAPGPSAPFRPLFPAAQVLGTQVTVASSGRFSRAVPPAPTPGSGGLGGCLGPAEAPAVSPARCRGRSRAAGGGGAALPGWGGGGGSSLGLRLGLVPAGLSGAFTTNRTAGGCGLEAQ